MNYDMKLVENLTILDSSDFKQSEKDRIKNECMAVSLVAMAESYPLPPMATVCYNINVKI